MKKEEVELIIIGVSLNNQQLLHMKIYKDGTLCRSGCGGLPAFPISGMTVEGKKDYWESLIGLLDEQIFQQPVVYQEENIKAPLEYFMAFLGESSNGQTGEQAAWTKSSGIRFLLDNNTNFRHPLLAFLDGFVIKAAETTNDWYFDIVMMALYDLKAKHLENTFIAVPKTVTNKQELLSGYVHQIMANQARGWDIVKIGNGRKYFTQDGVELTSSVENTMGKVSVNFYSSTNPNNFGKANVNQQQPEAPQEVTKKWWEFWK